MCPTLRLACGAIRLFFLIFLLRENLVKKNFEKTPDFKVLKNGDLRVVFGVKTVVFGYPRTANQVFHSTIRLTTQICPEMWVFKFFRIKQWISFEIVQIEERKGQR